MPFSFNLVSRSITTQLNLKFIQLINVKMPTIVGILTFISRINTSEIFKGRKVSIFQHFSFYEVELPCLVEINMKNFLQPLGQNLVDFHLPSTRIYITENQNCPICKYQIKQIYRKVSLIICLANFFFTTFLDLNQQF